MKGNKKTPPIEQRLVGEQQKNYFNHIKFGRKKEMEKQIQLPISQMANGAIQEKLDGEFKKGI